MLGSAAIIRLARPRCAAAALTGTVPFSSVPLSHLFTMNCSVSKNSDNLRSGRCHRQTLAGSNPYQDMQTKTIRWVASKTKGQQPTNPTPDDDENSEDAPATVSGSSQHDTWVQFQRSIAVSGFDTGQTVRERNLDKKNRGGTIARKRKEREAEAEAALKGVDTTQVRERQFIL